MRSLRPARAIFSLAGVTLAFASPSFAEDLAAAEEASAAAAAETTAPGGNTDTTTGDAAPTGARSRIRYLLQGIEVRGNTRTRDRVVLRYVPFRAGDLLDVNDPELELTRYRLLGTSFFSSAQLSLRKGDRRGEVILVIDVSDEVCREVASRYPVRVLVTDVPGKRDALRRGWTAARTELVALVDSDTVWAPNVAAEVCKPFADPRIGGVGTR